MAQRKCKVGEEKWAIIDEVEKLMEVDFIAEIKYLTWLANVVLVRNISQK